MDSDMREVTKKMKHLSEYDKEVLTGIFDNLLKQQKEMFDEIRQRNERQIGQRNTSDKWKIVTALIPETELDEAKKNGLHELVRITGFAGKQNYERLTKMSQGSLDHSLYSAGIAFLTCRYSEVRCWLNRSYKALITGPDGSREVSYRFEKYGALKKTEEILEKTALQYEVDIPILLSPVSRRAVHVIVDLAGNELSASDKVVIDFKLRENGLTGLVEENKTMVWNVEITEKNEIPRPRENTDKTIRKKVTPLFDELYQIYEFPAGDDEYYYVETQIHDVKRYQNSIYMNLHESEKIEDTRYSKVRICQVPQLYLEKMTCSFTTFFAMDRMHKERIRTEGDIDYVMNTLKNNVAVYSGLCRGKQEEPVRVYDSFDAYHYPKNKVLRSSSVCNIKFENSENRYFEDYVSYIMAYLNYYYPEFYWVGVV